MFKIIKYYYKNGKYSKDDILKFLAAGLITEKEYNSLVEPKGDDK